MATEPKTSALTDNMLRALERAGRLPSGMRERERIAHGGLVEAAESNARSCNSYANGRSRRNQRSDDDATLMQLSNLWNASNDATMRNCARSEERRVGKECRFGGAVED